MYDRLQVDRHKHMSAPTYATLEHKKLNLYACINYSLKILNFKFNIKQIENVYNAYMDFGEYLLPELDFGISIDFKE